jgi:4-carboxymuconolactone decarboxylase
LDIPLRTSADTDGEVQRVLSKLEPKGNNLKVIRLLANAPNGFRPFVLMSNALMNLSDVPPDVREVAILHLAARRGVNYEWEEHISMSEDAGITKEQRTALETGSIDDLSLFTEDQQLAIRAANEVVENGLLSEASWARACETWGLPTAMEFLMVVAWWGAFVPTLIEAIGLHSPSS